MRCEVRRSLSAAEAVVGLAANAASFPLHSKILLSGAGAALLAVAAVPLLSGSEMPPVTANGTLRCYGSAGNYEPCATPASASPLQLNIRKTAVDPPASWTTTVLYRQARWSTAAADEPANWEASPTSLTAQHCAGKTRGRARLPAQADTVLLFRFAQRADADCICRCKSGPGATRQGAPLERDAV